MRGDEMGVYFLAPMSAGSAAVLFGGLLLFDIFGWFALVIILFVVLLIAVIVAWQLLWVRSH